MANLLKSRNLIILSSFLTFHLMEDVSCLKLSLREDPSADITQEDVLTYASTDESLQPFDKNPEEATEVVEDGTQSSLD